jgi:hypothetical protein
MKIDLLKKACEYIWGDRYKARAASDLGIHKRTLFRYLDGDVKTIPDFIRVSLVKHCQNKIKDGDKVLKSLKGE